MRRKLSLFICILSFIAGCAPHAKVQHLSFDSSFIANEVERRLNAYDSIKKEYNPYPISLQKQIDSICDSFNDTIPNAIRSSITNLLNAELAGKRIFRVTPYEEAIMDFEKYDHVNAKIFNKKVNFEDTIFKTDINCINYNFEVARSFLNTHFYHPALFEFCVFPKIVSFVQDTFLSTSEFSFNKFNDVVSFRLASFSCNANFESCHFGNSICFYNSTISKDLEFSTSRFDYLLCLRGAHFSDASHIYFDKASLPDMIDCSYTTGLKNDVDLTGANFENPLRYNKEKDKYTAPHYISLYKSDISKFHLDYIHFRLITDSTLAHYPDFPRKIPKDEAEAMYEALLSNFKTRGQMESYQLLDIEYQQYKWKNSTLPFFVIFPACWWNFGYQKGRVFLWVLGFLLVFTAITYRYIGYLNNVYKLEKIGNMDAILRLGKRRKMVPLRLWYSFVYTAAIFFRLTLKIEAIDYKKTKGTLYIILVYTVGLVCLAYMANYIVQK